MIQSTTNMFGTFANVGVGLTATKYVAEFRRKEPERAGRIIAMSSVVAVLSGALVGALMIVGSPWVARLLAAPHLKDIIAISGLALLLIVINDAQNGALAGFEAFQRQSKIQVAAAVAGFPISLLAVFFFGLRGAVWGLIASVALLVFLNYHAIQSEAAAAGVPILWREIRKEMGVFAGFSVPLLCSGVVYVPAMWLANTVMVNTPGGYAQMGLFSAADRWRTAILFLPAALGAVTLPVLANLRGEAAFHKYSSVLWTNIRLNVFLSFAVAAPVAMLAPWIMASYGSGFREGTWVLVVLCATSVASAAYSILGQALVSRGLVWKMFAFNSGWSILLLSAEWCLREHGALGLAQAYFVADMLRLTVALIYVYRIR